MNEILKKPWFWIFIGVDAIVVGVLIYWVIRDNSSPPEEEDGPRSFNLDDVTPGGSMTIECDATTFIVAIPEGEGYSAGTFHVNSGSYQSGALDRDGGLERVWVADVNGDRQDDAVFVIRSAGSGSYVSLVAFASVGDTYTIRTLSELSGEWVDGYMGHDSIRVVGSQIQRSFPTYSEVDAPRLDRQWELADARQGELPIKVRPDSNADPSGGTITLVYQWDADRWERK